MVKSCMRGNGGSHAFECEICGSIGVNIFKIKYTIPQRDKRGAMMMESKDKELWICPKCVSEFADAIIRSRIEE